MTKNQKSTVAATRTTALRSAKREGERKQRLLYLVIFAFAIVMSILIYLNLPNLLDGDSFIQVNQTGIWIKTEGPTGAYQINLYSDVPNLEIHPYHLLAQIKNVYEWLRINRPGINVTVPQELRLFFSKEKLFDIEVAIQHQLAPNSDLFQAFHSKVAEYNRGESTAHPGFTTRPEIDSKSVICAIGMGGPVGLWHIKHEATAPKEIFPNSRQNGSYFATGRELAHIFLTHEIIHALTMDHEFASIGETEELAYGEDRIIYNASKIEIFRLKK